MWMKSECKHWQRIEICYLTRARQDSLMTPVYAIEDTDSNY
jgi:hypothetical protein